MSINGIGSSAMYGMTQAQRTSSAQMANDLFSQLDSSGDGKVELSDLQSAISSLSDSEGMMSAEDMFSQMDENSDGEVTEQEMTATFEQLALEFSFRMMGNESQSAGPPPPPPPSDMETDSGFTQDQLAEMIESGEDSSMTDMFSELASNFEEADTDGNGSITRDEAMSFMGDDMPPPPPPPGGPMSETDDGLTQEQLTEMASTAEDDAISSLISQLADNFEDADANEDGKITLDEAKAYEQEQTASSDKQSANVALNAQMRESLNSLLSHYGESNTTSSGFSITA